MNEEERRPEFMGSDVADLCERAGTLEVGDVRIDRSTLSTWDGEKWEPVRVKDEPAPAKATPTAVSCSRCGKRVSNLVTTVDSGPLVVRAWIECPECVEASAKANPEPRLAAILRRFLAGAPANYVRAVGDALTLDGDVQITPEDKALIERIQIEESRR